MTNSSICFRNVSQQAEFFLSSANPQERRSKKLDSLYHSVSLLPYISKVYEKVFHNQLIQYLEQDDLLV